HHLAPGAPRRRRPRRRDLVPARERARPDAARHRRPPGDVRMRLRKVDERLRLMQVYSTLSRYGVDLAFDRSPVAPFRRRMQQWIWRPPTPVVALPPQVKVRLLLQDLGPTYVKLGQIVSSQGRAL